MNDRAESVPVLRVQGLRTEFKTPKGVVVPVNDVSFTLRRGEVMGLVGESGSGKSMTGFSIMGLIDPPGRVTGGVVEFTGRDGMTTDLRSLSPARLRDIRGNRIAMIFQDPMMTLNPVLRIDTQMIEAIQAHGAVGRAQALERAREALVKVGIPSPDERLQAYPHQFSGGMRQRVAIAIALLNQPDVIIADEPTTALDVTIQGQILHEVQRLCAESGTALIWITHDLSVVAGLADTLAVMYAGRIVESGPVRQVLESPSHPYTGGLIACAPSRNERGQPLRQISGTTPALGKLPPGCAFAARCAASDAACTRQVPDETRRADRSVRCHHPLQPFARGDR
jgi:peptide/nickel transport system ATP-binding protein